jgi:hypothetical protein
MPGRDARPPAPRSGATVSGQALLIGKPPAPAPQPHGSDPYCAKKELADDSLVVDGQGGIRSVFVRVVEAAGGPYAPPSEPVNVTQLDCRYRPRVLGAVRGQPVVVSNSDGTLHNVHALLGDTTLLNQVQVDSAAPLIDLQKALRQMDAAAPRPAEAPLRLRCDVHPWMSAYLFVLDHPFFAVTAEDGRFTLRNLPPGDYTLQAFHERLGTQSARIHVAPSEPAATPAKIEFRFTMEKAAPG